MSDFNSEASGVPPLTFDSDCWVDETPSLVTGVGVATVVLASTVPKTPLLEDIYPAPGPEKANLRLKQIDCQPVKRN